MLLYARPLTGRASVAELATRLSLLRVEYEAAVSYTFPLLHKNEFGFRDGGIVATHYLTPSDDGTKATAGENFIECTNCPYKSHLPLEE